jgi:mannonate dehydratase
MLTPSHCGPQHRSQHERTVVFHGALQIKDGYAWISEKPGWGIEVDEALAAKHPITGEHPNEFRTKDGSVIQGTG